MHRILMEKLINWKEKKNRLPLILQGARQTGKTWLLKEFGKKYFEDVLYINFEETKIEEVFDKVADTNRIIEYLAALHRKKIYPGKTLIIFDEIQEVPKALTSLKYFAENSPEYHICCAGSLIGVGLHQGISFPVGKVEFLYLHPHCEKFFILNICNESTICLSIMQYILFFEIKLIFLFHVYNSEIYFTNNSILLKFFGYKLLSFNLVIKIFLTSIILL